MRKLLKYALDDTAIEAGAKFAEPRPGDAGYDLYASSPVTIFPTEQKVVPTGLKIEIPKGYVALIKDRSSLAMKKVFTSAGVIDSSFRGAISVLLRNDSEKSFHIEPGHKVAQLIFLPIEIPVVSLVADGDLSKTARGDGAFGSTGE